MPVILFCLTEMRNRTPQLRLGVGPSFQGRLPVPVTTWRINGVAKDSTGAPLSGATLSLYRTLDDGLVERVLSDANGLYSFSTIGLAQNYYIVAYKAGSPDVAGTTVNTLVGNA